MARTSRPAATQAPLADDVAPTLGTATRRRWLLALAGAGGGAAAVLWPAAPALALPARTLQFPRDHGSHPELRTEWWYITGHAQAGGRPWGFQVTFFRSRVDETQGLRSAFAAKQLVFAHAAVTDVRGARLLHDQRIARAGFGVAQASEADTDVRLRDWSLLRTSVGARDSVATPAVATAAPAAATASPSAAVSSRYATRIAGSGFALDLVFDTTQPVLLQGRAGLSRKGPTETQASYYYSQPQLAVRGSITVGGERMAVAEGSGRAWMDHEWSEALMHPEAQGWDWIGMNLRDGGALTAFRLRRADGTALWAGGSLRAAANAQTRVFGSDEVQFTPERLWTSPISGTRYPVQWRVRTPGGTFYVRPVMDKQELDSSGSTGAIYWEGLSDLLDAAGTPVGRGYLEMTGYAKPLRL